MRLILGSRGSKLALWQAHWIKSQLEAQGHEIGIRVIRTSGDKLATASLAQSGTKGLFVKEIEEALLEGSVDLAVHSLKDLPVDQPERLCVAAVPPREDARDALIARDGQKLMDLPSGARIGTSSLRRRSQLLGLRTDIEIVPVRGNVDTRLRKLDAGEYDALVIAAAGTHRLGFERWITEYFSPCQMCPAAGQGALAVEIRCGDERVAQTVNSLDDQNTHLAIRAERAVLRRLGGGCQTPIAAYATIEGDCITIIGVVADPGGTRIIRGSARGEKNDPEAAGARLAQDLLNQGAKAILHG
jgi:hydroxymethylbilane synthase